MLAWEGRPLARRSCVSSQFTRHAFPLAPATAAEPERGTSGSPRHTNRSRYRCSLPGLAGFAGTRCTEPEVPRSGSPVPSQDFGTRKSRERQQCRVYHGALAVPSRRLLARSLELACVKFPASRCRARMETRAHFSLPPAPASGYSGVGFLRNSTAAPALAPTKRGRRNA